MARETASKTFRRVTPDIEHAEFIAARVDEYIEEHMDELKGDRRKLQKMLNWNTEWQELVAELKAPAKEAPPAVSRPASSPRADKAKEVSPPQK